MKTIWYLLLVAIVIIACNTKGNGNTVDTQHSENQTYECDLFTVSYPNGYYAKEEGPTRGNFRTLLIGKDSLDKDVTTIMWEVPNTFPSSVKDFITIFTSNEIKEYEKEYEESDTFYNVMEIDSTYMVSGYPTYSISSIFVERGDTIIQSRTGLIIPGRCDMMIIQRANVKKPNDEVKVMADIIQSIKIKKE